MVDRVSFDTTKAGFVSISGTCPEDSDDMQCEIQTFAEGSRGECVKIFSRRWLPRTTANGR